MITHHWKRLVPLFVVLALAIGVSVASAQATLRVQLLAYPHWSQVETLPVDELPLSERPDYDVFRYGGRFYAYDGDRWYVSDRESGTYSEMDQDRIPDVFSTIPREHWRYYPTAYDNDYNNNYNYNNNNNNNNTYRSDRMRSEYGGDASARLHIEFNSPRHWMSVSGTDVYELPMSERDHHDVFRYRDFYYTYSHGNWYRSAYESGDYAEIDASMVPGEISRVPRDHWMVYPSDWSGRSTIVSVPNTIDIQMSGQPQWTDIHGSPVRVIRSGYSDRDMFRYHGSYYVYMDGNWYFSSHHRGTFRRISDSDVPAVFTSVPRQYWHNYPDSWPNDRTHHHSHVHY
jgi:hypothetical protein